MARDPYDILGVKRDASQSEIKSAYRKLAKKLHPDLNPGDAAAEKRFKEVSSAYSILEDEGKRARFDKGEIDADGVEQAPRSYYRDYASAQGGAGGRYQSAGGFSDFGDAEDIFSGFFGGQGRGRANVAGRDRNYTMEIDLLEAANGANRQITLPNGPALDLKIPAGTRDGQTLRLRGKGEPGSNGAPTGDALIEIRVKLHEIFKLDGDDIRIAAPISLREAVLGGKITVPTLTGSVALTLPPNSNSGKTLRLKGKGFPKRGGQAGDAYVILTVMLPDQADADLTEFMKGWAAGEQQAPRKTWGSQS